jgi:hypothetical protein
VVPAELGGHNEPHACQLQQPALLQQLHPLQPCLRHALLAVPQAALLQHHAHSAERAVAATAVVLQQALVTLSQWPCPARPTHHTTASQPSCLQPAQLSGGLQLCQAQPLPKRQCFTNRLVTACRKLHGMRSGCSVLLHTGGQALGQVALVLGGSAAGQAALRVAWTVTGKRWVN